MGSALGNNYGKSYSFLSKPVQLDLNFIVDATNGNGAGVRSVKGQGVKSVFMATSASMTGTVATSANQITSITGGTSSLTVGMAVAGTGIPAGTTITSIISSSAVGISATPTGNHSSETITYTAAGSPMVNTGVSSASVGYALIHLRYNYNHAYAGPYNILSPSTGGTVAINSTSLTVGQPYIIASVGHGAAGAATYAPVADSAGSLAGTYFLLFDSYGNTYVIWFSVTGVGGVQPAGVGGIPIQVTIASGSTASQITTAVSNAVLLISSAIAGVQLPSGVAPFTTSGGGTATLTFTSTANLPLNGPPQDGAGSLATGSTFALTVYNTNLQNWQGVGLPKGVTPNVGASFIATATGSSTGGGSTGTVVAVGVSGIISLETIGDPNQSIGPMPMGGSPNVGSWILVQFLAPTVSGSAYDTPMIPTAPANNTVISMTLYLEQSTEVGGNGE